MWKKTNFGIFSTRTKVVNISNTLQLDLKNSISVIEGVKENLSNILRTTISCTALQISTRRPYAV